MKEPAIVEEVRQEVRKNFVCPYCSGSRRVDVTWEKGEKGEIEVLIECQAFLPGGMERCLNVVSRFYGGIY